MEGSRAGYERVKGRGRWSGDVRQDRYGKGEGTVWYGTLV